MKVCAKNSAYLWWFCHWYFITHLPHFTWHTFIDAVSHEVNSKHKEQRIGIKELNLCDYCRLWRAECEPKKRKCSTVSRNAPHCHTVSMTFWYRTSADVRYRFKRPNFTNILWKCENAMILVFDFIDPITVYFCTLSLSSSFRLLLFLFFLFGWVAVTLLSPQSLKHFLIWSVASLYRLLHRWRWEKNYPKTFHINEFEYWLDSVLWFHSHSNFSRNGIPMKSFSAKTLDMYIREKRKKNKTEQMKWNLFLRFAKFGVFFSYSIAMDIRSVVNMNNK